MQPYLNLKGGFERVILKIAQHYKAPIYTLEYDRKGTFPEFGDVEVKILGKNESVSRLLPYRASQGFRYGYNFYNLKIKEDYDVINSHISPSEWIRHKNKRVVWYCHTPPREVYDLYHVRMRNRSGREKLLYAAMTSTYKLIAKGIVRNIEQIAANSNNTKERISRYYGRDATVINPGPGLDYSEFSNNGDEKFFFYPSRIVVNKRQDYVVDAFRHFAKRSKKNYKLIMAGPVSRDPEHRAYADKLRKLSAGYRIEIRTDISDRELISLYSRCSAVVYAPINEDFGLVPLEGMASSKPVIAVNEGGPREVILDGKTGFLVNSPAEMADRMQFIAEHQSAATKMGKDGRKLATTRYTWDAFFDKFDPLLRKTAKSS